MVTLMAVFQSVATGRGDGRGNRVASGQASDVHDGVRRADWTVRARAGKPFRGHRSPDDRAERRNPQLRDEVISGPRLRPL